MSEIEEKEKKGENIRKGREEENEEGYERERGKEIKGMEVKKI